MGEYGNDAQSWFYANMYEIGRQNCMLKPFDSFHQWYESHKWLVKRNSIPSSSFPPGINEIDINNKIRIKCSNVINIFGGNRHFIHSLPSITDFQFDLHN